jgi:hypothetical protein
MWRFWADMITATLGQAGYEIKTKEKQQNWKIKD